MSQDKPVLPARMTHEDLYSFCCRIAKGDEYALACLEGALSAIERQGSGWISVEERLPTDPRDQIMSLVLCEATEDDAEGVSVASYDDDEKEWTHRLDTGCWAPGPVIAWQPMPSPQAQDAQTGEGK